LIPNFLGIGYGLGIWVIWVLGRKLCTGGTFKIYNRI
jgi:hypothetical protein